MTECLIAFGGNLSNPKVTFQMALSSLCSEGFKLTSKSGLWRTPPWPAGTDQPDYLNAVVKGRYRGEAIDLLKQLNALEDTHGRVRSVPNAARTLDLDLLEFGSLKCQTEQLTLPHPRMLQRAFVLVPASEIETKWIHHARLLPEEDIRNMRYAGAW